MKAKIDTECFRTERLTPDRIAEAAEIEKLCFSEPWSEEALLYMCTSPNTYAVAVTDISSGKLAAYGGVEYVLDQANIVNVATHPDYRRRGCASVIMQDLEAFLRGNGVCEVYLEVRRSNIGARALYEREGYTVLGVRKNYYRFPQEDALVMTKKIN